MMKSNVAIELKRLRDRLPDWSLRKTAVELGYADGSSYQRYEDAEKMADKPLPLHLAWRIIEKLEGKGQPPINREEILALVGGDMSRHANVPLLPVEGLPIEGIVAAGVWREADFPLGAGGDTRLPADPNAKYRGVRQFAVLVQCQSVNRHIGDGEYAICLHFADIMREPRDGDLVVVQRTRDGGLHEYSIKRLKMARDGSLELWPESTNPDFQTKLDFGDAREHTEIAVIGLVIGKYAPL